MNKIKRIFQKENEEQRVRKTREEGNKKSLKNILDYPNFAKSIIENEMSVEMEDFSLKNIQNLMKLYSEAIDYYIAIQSNNALYFKQKMNILLLKPSVRNLLEKKCEIKTIKKYKNQESSDDAETLKKNTNSKSLFSLKKKNFQINTHLSSTMQDKQEIRNIINSHKVISELKNQVIGNSIKEQKDEIDWKIHTRKMKSTEIYKNRKQNEKNIS